ncbi:hypothetical protein Tco_1064778 [Tanacetum coccineum]
MLVIKRFRERKKIFRERKLSENSCKEVCFSAGNEAIFIGRKTQLSLRAGGYIRAYCQSKGSKVEEKLVHLMMVVKFEVLIEKKKMCSLGLMRFDWLMEFLMVQFREVGDEVVVDESVV